MAGIGRLMLDLSIFNGAGGANEINTKNGRVLLKENSIFL